MAKLFLSALADKCVIKFPFLLDFSTGSGMGWMRMHGLPAFSLARQWRYHRMRSLAY